MPADLTNLPRTIWWDTDPQSGVAGVYLIDQTRMPLQGDVPSPIDPPVGCTFHTRCPYARDVCMERRPAFREVEPGHMCACHKVDEDWRE